MTQWNFAHRSMSQMYHRLIYCTESDAVSKWTIHPSVLVGIQRYYRVLML